MRCAGDYRQARIKWLSWCAIPDVTGAKPASPDPAPHEFRHIPEYQCVEKNGFSVHLDTRLDQCAGQFDIAGCAFRFAWLGPA